MILLVVLHAHHMHCTQLIVITCYWHTCSLLLGTLVAHALLTLLHAHHAPHTQLSVTKGEELEIIDNMDDKGAFRKWWVCRNDAGGMGKVPSNFVTNPPVEKVSQLVFGGLWWSQRCHFVVGDFWWSQKCQMAVGSWW